MDPSRERAAVIASLEDALEPLLAHSASLRSDLLNGASFASAMRGARDSSGVAAARIEPAEKKGEPVSRSPCAFDTGEPAVRAVLTAMKFDPAIRCAAALNYSDRALEVFEDDLFLSRASCTPGPSAPTTGPMDWGIASCCREEVPDVIYEKNPAPARSRLLLFGEGPADVVNNIIICLGRI